MRKAILALALTAAAFAGPRPKVRAITAFIDVDAQNYTRQIENAVKFLNGAREQYRAAGWEVQTIRIATQPFPEYTKGMSREAALGVLHGIDSLGAKLAFTPSIGPAMWNDGDSAAAVDLLIDFLSTPGRTNASLITASVDGIHWNAIRQAARLIKTVSQRSAHGQGNLNFAAIAMLKPYGPFYPGAYHAGGSRAFSVGVEGAGVVAEVFAQDRDPRTAEKKLAAALTAQLREVEKVAVQVASGGGWTYQGIDPTPAPLGDVSIGRAIESFIGGPFGSSGTMTAAAVITRAVQSVPVKRVGYSGLMVPVLEDAVLAKRWAEGTYTVDALLAYSAVCAGGLDTIPLPGDISEDRLAHMLSDVATLAFKWQKPLAARLLPAPGRKSGETTQFEDSRMANTVIH
ncbi:MAG TPA: DUF711 family protein [Candidatus Sulfopaludibacter sp.]|jgi:hypothetical protein|nr:DUF711 family protein [Candidatus Sulfopaludibacter sp.]